MLFIEKFNEYRTGVDSESLNMTESGVVYQNLIIPREGDWVIIRNCNGGLTYVPIENIYNPVRSNENMEAVFGKNHE